MLLKGVVALFFTPLKNNILSTRFVSAIPAYNIQNNPMKNEYKSKDGLRRRILGLIGDGNYDQVGETLTFGDSDTKCGFDVDITNDGRTILIGCPGINEAQIYRLVTDALGNDKWSFLTSVSGDVGDATGASVEFAQDADIFAVGSTTHNGKGKVQVFQLSGTTNSPVITQIGQDIVGEMVNDYFGASLDMSGDGKTIIIGADAKEIDQSNTATYLIGYAKIYSFNNNNKTWFQSKKIVGDQGERFGFSVATSGNGQKFVIGAERAGNSNGRVIIYDDVSKSQAEITGEGAERFGSSVGINKDSNAVAVGSSAFKCSFNNCGRVQFFQVTDIQNPIFVTSIEGTAQGDRCGRSLELSSDLTYDDGTIVIGCRGKVIVATNKGNPTNIEFEQRELTNGSNTDFFGSGIGLSSVRQALIVGAPAGSGINANDRANVRVFGNPEDATPSPTLTPTFNPTSKAPSPPTSPPTSLPTSSPKATRSPTMLPTVKGIDPTKSSKGKSKKSKKSKKKSQKIKDSSPKGKSEKKDSKRKTAKSSKGGKKSKKRRLRSS